METIRRLDECGTLHSIPRKDGITDSYLVEIPAEPYLLVSMGACYGTPMAKFKHPNILAKVDRVFEFKHSRNNGSKFWTACAGVDFFFAIPKHRIHLIEEQGYSYVPILVSGQKYVLNVSGGTGGNNYGWKDFIRQGSSLIMPKTKKELMHLAECAMSREEAEKNGVGSYLEKYLARETNAKYFTELCAKNDCKLKVGDKVMLDDGSTFNGSCGPFSVVYKERQLMICTDNHGNRVRVKRKYINWSHTAMLIGVALKEPVSEAYIRIPSTVLASLPSSFIP